MLHFIAISVVILLVVVLYIRKGKKENSQYTEKYQNAYLNKYMESGAELSDEEMYKLLAQASSLYMQHEEELKQETQWVNALFYLRMVSNATWDGLKAIKEDLEFEKLFIDSELRRFEKNPSGSSADTGKKEKKHTSMQKEEIHQADTTDQKKALYQRITQKIKEESEC
ncbi:hypothetical protein NECID01_1802 [Nematocida sp. AWRm77]|nr:hypothetical protein NECID01_1802 [Nematocida sp. AWRm77]